MSQKNSRIAFTIQLLLLAIILPLAACKKSEDPQKPSIGVFASPDDSLQVRAKGYGDREIQLAGQSVAISIEMQPKVNKKPVAARPKKGH